MTHAWRKLGMHTKFWSEFINIREHLGDPVKDGRAWTVFIWLRIRNMGSIKVGNLLTSSATISFSRTSLLHRVSY
jgi:hypothetical protein